MSDNIPITSENTAYEAEVRELMAEADALRAKLAKGEHLTGRVPHQSITEIPDGDPPVCPALWNIRNLQMTGNVQNLDSRAHAVESEIEAARAGSASLGDTVNGILEKVGGISSTLTGIAAPASVQRVMSLDWLYRSNRLAFELFDAGYRQQNHMGIPVIDGKASGNGLPDEMTIRGGIMGDDSLDVADTSGLTVGEYYLLTDGTDTRMVCVDEILTETRIRVSPILDRNWETGATLTGSTFTPKGGGGILEGVTARIGSQWISRIINLGTDKSDRSVIVRRTFNDDIRVPLYFRDGRNPDWVEVNWEFRRSNNMDIPNGFADYEYIFPMSGDGAIRLQVLNGEVDIFHIAALGSPTDLGGVSNSNNLPPSPVLLIPSDGEEGVKETPAFSIRPVINEWESIQFDVCDSLGESIFDSPQTQTGTQYSLPPGLLVAGTEYTWMARNQDKKGRWSEWSSAKFTCASEFKYIKTPTVTAPADGASDINAEDTLTLTGSAFAVTGGSDTFAAQQWQVTDALGVVWTSAQVTTSGNVTLPANTLTAGWKAYTVQVRHKGAALGWSEWSDPVTITTKGFNLEPATTVKLGGVMFATTAEAQAGTNASKAVTPAGVAAALAKYQADNPVPQPWPLGMIMLMPFRAADLPKGWHICNGGGFATTSAQGKALAALPANFKTDWKITTSGSTIYKPNLLTGGEVSGQGPFFRPSNSTPGTVTGDAIRNITGAWHSKYGLHPQGDNGSVGSSFCKGAITKGAKTPGYMSGDASYAGDELAFDAALIVPTAAENRPLAVAMTPAIWLGC